MGLFGDDKRQDERLEALELHVRALTEALEQSQLDLAETRIALLQVQARLDEKLSISEIDPVLLEVNKQLAEARQQSQESSAAAAESWATLQGGAREAFQTLRSSIEEAAERLKQA